MGSSQQDWQEMDKAGYRFARCTCGKRHSVQATTMPWQGSWKVVIRCNQCRRSVEAEYDDKLEAQEKARKVWRYNNVQP